jgi:hypothetical protein
MSGAEFPAMSSELRLELARHRHKLFECLVQLVEADRASAIARDTRSAQGERSELFANPPGSLKRTLKALEDALRGLRTTWSELVDETGTGLPGTHERTIEDVLSKVEEFLVEIERPPPGAPPIHFVEELRSPLAQFLREWFPVKKILIAVHGIGDQFNFATIQSVAHRVCEYVGQPAAMPLGRFHGNIATITRAYLPDPDRDPHVNCGFAEIYWADVPRKPAVEKYILEEPKNWARTLVERLELRAQHDKWKYTHADTERARHDTELVQHVLDEMIQAVVVVDRLPFLAGSAGFNLKKLLIDYLNDVQVVTEFDKYRQQLLDIFRTVVETTNKFFPEADLYFIAHSEGTVISFIGLLKGLSSNAEWAKKVKGLMTIGSPLNKHVRLWPELFSEYLAPDQLPDGMEPIKWRNYYDYGDPIAYNLRSTRRWMADHGWMPFFNFKDARDKKSSANGIPGTPPGTAPGSDADEFGGDIGFCRYYFPGAAHYDYWRDPEVFGHFLQTVVDPEGEILPPASQTKFTTPGTINLAWVTSYSLPYLLSSGLLLVGVYLMYKAVRACLDPIGAVLESPGEIIGNVLGLFGLLAGTTLIARIPRLTRNLKQRMWALLGVVESLAYLFLVSPENQVSIATFLRDSFPMIRVALAVLLFVVCALLYWRTWGLFEGELPANVRSIVPVLLTVLPVSVCYLGLSIASAQLDRVNIVIPGHVPLPLGRSLGVVFIAWVVGMAAWLVSRQFPRVGLKPLLHTSALVLFLVILAQLSFNRLGSRVDREHRMMSTLHRRIKFLETRLSDYRRTLEKDRQTLEQEIAANKEHGFSPAELEERTAAKAAIDRLIDRRGVLEARRTELERDMHELARRWAPRTELQTKLNEIEIINEQLLVDEMASNDRRDTEDAAALEVVTEAARIQGPVWPVILSGAALFYLWWLAVLTFDLAFIWHLYIKNEAAEVYIENRLKNAQ